MMLAVVVQYVFLSLRSSLLLQQLGGRRTVAQQIKGTLVIVANSVGDHFANLASPSYLNCRAAQYTDSMKIAGNSA